MAKTYFLLIGALLLLALAIGGFALYKSNTPTPLQTAQPSQSLEKTNSQTGQTPLSIISPKNGAQVSGSTVQVTGKTAANADVSVNDSDLKADASGNFTTTINLDEGDNEIIVTAVDATGAVAESNLTVTYTPAE